MISVGTTNVRAQDTLTFHLDRSVGMALGNLVQGTFVLRGSGPDSIVNLTVLFNNEQVHFVESNIINWEFDTAGYPSGTTNITLFGMDDLGVIYSVSDEVYFIGGMTSTLLTAGVLIFVAVLVCVKYGPALGGRRNK